MTAPAPQKQYDPNAFLMGGGGAKSARFTTVGDEVGGRIVSEPEVKQQTEFVRGGGAGKPLFWDNGDPKMQLVVKVQTDLREDAEDDGVRALYLKGGFKRDTTQKAAADAVRAAGAQGLKVGGELYLRLTHIDGDSQDAAKSFSGRYVPPSAGFLQPAAAAPTAQPAPVVAASAPQPAYVPPVAAPVAAPAAPVQMVTLPDGSQVTPEIAALLGQVQPPAA